MYQLPKGLNPPLKPFFAVHRECCHLGRGSKQPPLSLVHVCSLRVKREFERLVLTLQPSNRLMQSCRAPDHLSSLLVPSHHLGLVH